MEGGKSMNEMDELMKGQTPIYWEQEAELFGILDMVAWIQVFALRTKSEHGKNAFYSMGRSLLARFLAVRKQTIYRFVPIGFFIKYVARKMKEVKVVLK